MKPKIYPTEKVEEVAKALANAPPLPPRYLPHCEVISELSKDIRELHFKKNYDARQIVALLKENGIRTTLREVRNLLEITSKPPQK